MALQKGLGAVPVALPQLPFPPLHHGAAARREKPEAALVVPARVLVGEGGAVEGREEEPPRGGVPRVRVEAREEAREGWGLGCLVRVRVLGVGVGWLVLGVAGRERRRGGEHGGCVARSRLGGAVRKNEVSDTRQRRPACAHAHARECAGSTG